MNHLTNLSETDPKCPGYMGPEEGPLYTLYEYCLDEEGIEFCNVQYFDLELDGSLDDYLGAIDRKCLYGTLDECSYSVTYADHYGAEIKVTTTEEVITYRFS